MVFLSYLILFYLLTAAVLWLGARIFLTGRSLHEFDQPAGELASSRPAPGPEQAEVLRQLAELRRRLRHARRTRSLSAMRREIDAAFGALAPAPEAAEVTVREVDAGGVPAEWVLAAGSEPARRLLYLHGGAFVSGSPRSHRALTMALAARAGVAVLAIDYRLQPEHGRYAGLVDCQRAYRWLLEHGPDGDTPARDVYLAGDSAGGAFALALLAWIRDTGLRQVDAALAFAPATDATLSSPSLRANVETDPFLGPTLGRLMRLPRWLLAWLTLLSARLPPQHPLMSPVRGTLAALPPTLVQASTSEMLLDDARRYVNRANREGSPAVLALWPAQIHVWQLFERVSPEAREALDQAAAFLQRHRSH